MAKGKSLSGRGGMAGKLTAARLATAAGIAVHIINGSDQAKLKDIIIGQKQAGTVCQPRAQQIADLSRRDRWLLSAQNTGASIQVDDGAVAAIQKRKSLLAVGVKQIYGKFAVKECVELVDSRRETVALGLTALSSVALQKMLLSSEKAYNMEVVHADNVYILS